jgi:hypothetical protein
MGTRDAQPPGYNLSCSGTKIQWAIVTPCDWGIIEDDLAYDDADRAGPAHNIYASPYRLCHIGRGAATENTCTYYEKNLRLTKRPKIVEKYLR